MYVKPNAYPLWRKGDRLRASNVIAADLAGSTCDADKFLNNDLEVVRVEHFDMDTVRRNVASEHSDATWMAIGSHNPSLRTHHRLRLRFVDKTVCTAWPMGPNGYWNPAITTMTLTGTPKIPGAMTRPASGQTPTFFPPQRIGGIDDVGAVDVAAIDVLSHKGIRDSQKDVCLLFRGRPIKCYVLPEMPVGRAGQQVYDASNVMDVVYPDTFDDMHDAIQFARITSSGVGRTFTAPGWQFEGEYLVLNWEDDVTTPGVNERVPPGVTAGSVIEITNWDATFDVSFLLERNKGRFYVEEAGEFFIKFRTGTATWRYVDGSYNPCDSVETGTVYDRTVDETCADPVWIQQANKIPRCDVHGPLCKRGTDNTDCASLGYGATVAFDSTYASVQTLGADDDTCAFSGNGFCEDSAVGNTASEATAYKVRGIGSGSPIADQTRQNPRWQAASYVFKNTETACPRSEMVRLFFCVFCFLLATLTPTHTDLALPSFNPNSASVIRVHRRKSTSLQIEMHALGRAATDGHRVLSRSTLRQGRSASWAPTLPRAESGSSPSRWTSPSPSTTASTPTGEAKDRSASASSRRPLPPTSGRCRREEETSSPPGWDSWSCAKSRSPPSSSPSLAPRE